ncbi:hypothetical protein BUALT_BualtUnG0061100 [Buddleja alternifolia]|uniref:Uncharacterized protein n=1 Tax=Buddleja alternifolia TaxID=168488 RepID=A0AAV6W4P3_9LAMI|nr:hypothetical protein BUALT_BualtUnG0061100 [Buddleja alternifolia]
MGLLTNRVERSEIKAGDHIYSYRAVFAYSHHGVNVPATMNCGRPADYAACPFRDPRVLRWSSMSSQHRQPVGSGHRRETFILFLVWSSPGKSVFPCLNFLSCGSLASIHISWSIEHESDSDSRLMGNLKEMPHNSRDGGESLLEMAQDSSDSNKLGQINQLILQIRRKTTSQSKGDEDDIHETMNGEGSCDKNKLNNIPSSQPNNGASMEEDKTNHSNPEKKRYGFAAMSTTW